MINIQLRLFGLDLLQLFASTEDAELVQYGNTGGEFQIAEVYDLEETGEEFGFHT